MGALRPSLHPSVGRFKLEAKLGAGGMGEVYRATDTHLRRTVALKLLPGRFAAHPEHLSRFEEEARAASALNHSNIVTIYDSGVSDGAPWIAMEYVEGRTLRQLARDGALSTDTVLRISCQIADGLTKAHEAGIVHRDLKPENVIVSSGGRVKILDFEATKLMRDDAPVCDRPDSETEYTTAPGTVLGTPAYMAPEQVRAQPTDDRSDQFALERFSTNFSSANTRSGAIQSRRRGRRFFAEPPRLEEVRSDLSPELAGVVARCLTKDPAHRFHRRAS